MLSKKCCLVGYIIIFIRKKKILNTSNAFQLKTKFTLTFSNIKNMSVFAKLMKSIFVKYDQTEDIF